MTFHYALNAGAVLQAYALQKYLINQGFNVEIINYRPKRKIGIRDFIAKKPIKIWHKTMDRLNAFRYERLDNFGGILQRSVSVYYSPIELQNNPPKYDVYIAGSDQIWNISSNYKIDKEYFLDFGSDSTKKIAYAASMNINHTQEFNLPVNLNITIKNLLTSFHAISLRETNAVNFIQSLFGNERQIEHVPDPTFLLDAEEYKKLLTDNCQPKEPYIAAYILAELAEEQKQAIRYIKNKKQLKIINLRNPDTCIRLNGAKNKITMPSEWLTYIYYANFTICCSFHAVVFSLIFHKSFIVITPRKNDRISSLLNVLGLENRIIINYNSKQLEQILNENIDWNLVDTILNKEREKGIKFLMNNLN